MEIMIGMGTIATRIGLEMEITAAVGTWTEFGITIRMRIGMETMIVIGMEMMIGIGRGWRWRQ